MEGRKKWLLRLLLLLFSISVSTEIVPCGIVNTYGLFGEVKSIVVEDDENTEIADEHQIYNTEKQVKGINILNIWFEILILIVCLIYVAYRFRLPRGDTIVTLKVRMDN